MKTNYRGSITCLFILIFAYTNVYGMQKSRKEALYQKTHEALKNNDPKKLASLLNEYNEAHKLEKKTEAQKRNYTKKNSKPLVEDSTSSQPLQKEELISLEEIEQASLISLVDIRNMTFKGKSNTTAHDIDPKLLELLSAAHSVIQERDAVAKSKIQEIRTWPTQSKLLIATGLGFIGGGIIKGGFDISAYYDKSNSGGNWYAALASDLVLILSGILPAYQGFSNTPAVVNEAFAYESRGIVEDAILKEVQTGSEDKHESREKKDSDSSDSSKDSHGKEEESEGWRFEE